MADNGHGGYRTPSQPAAVSGPGAHSARTDRGPKQYELTGGGYGDAQAFADQQSAAPLSAPAGAPGSTAPAGLDLSSIVPLGADSQMQDVPVTDGAAEGPGAGPDALGVGMDPLKEEARSVAPYLATMIRIADSDGASPGFKRYVRQIIHNL